MFLIRKPKIFFKTKNNFDFEEKYCVIFLLKKVINKKNKNNNVFK